MIGKVFQNYDKCVTIIFNKKKKKIYETMKVSVY